MLQIMDKLLEEDLKKNMSEPKIYMLGQEKVSDWKRGYSIGYIDGLKQAKELIKKLVNK